MSPHVGISTELWQMVASLTEAQQDVVRCVEFTLKTSIFNAEQSSDHRDVHRSCIGLLQFGTEKGHSGLRRFAIDCIVNSVCNFFSVLFIQQLD